MTGTGTVQLIAQTLPANRPVVWSSSASAYATVSEAGLVTGVTTGTATITATATINGQTYTDTCVVTVS